MATNNKFIRYVGSFDKSKKANVVKAIAKLVVSNVEGTFNFTDIMFQEGKFASGYTINTKEMLKRSNDKVMHYNILIRGKGNGIIVNNDGNVSSGLDFDIIAANNTTGAINIETLYKTKNLIIKDTAPAGGKLSIDSFKYTISKNGVANRNYGGSFLGIPSGFGLYNVDMNNRDMANFLFNIKIFDKKDNF